jgi:hypothetical protein
MIKSKSRRWVGHALRMGDKRNAYRMLVGKPEENRPIGRPRRRWEDNVRTDLGEVGWDVIDWIHLAQNRIQWGAPCEYGNEPSGFTKIYVIIGS